jgi:hypothetical protein
MATIGGNPAIQRSVPRADGSWLFTVSYTACFSPDEVGRRFDDTVGIRQVSCTGQDGCGSEAPVWFTATSTRVFRKKRIVVRGNCYDAVGGLDQVSARIALRRAGDVEVLDEHCTAAVMPAQRITGTAA